MTRLTALLLSAALAGGASAAVTVNGTAVAAGASGDGWTFAKPVVRLTGPGPFVVSGTDYAGGAVLRAEADCTVVVSNLALRPAASDVRARCDNPLSAFAVAENGAGRTVAVFADGLYHSGVGAAPLLPEDPATAYGAAVWVRDGAWEASDVSWNPASTNFAAVLWTGSRFVAARFRGGFAYSEGIGGGIHGGGRPAGESWEESEWDGSPVNLRALAIDPDRGTLVAASTQGLWMSEDEGGRWSQTTNLYANSVVWSDGVFVAVGELRGAAMEGVYWSSDGKHWTARGFGDLPSNLSFVVAGGNGRFLAGGASGWRALRLGNGTMQTDGSAAVSLGKFAVASGGGRYVACAGEGTGLRWSEDGLSWTRSDKRDGTFPTIVWRDGRFSAEGVDTNGAYAGIWTSPNGESWTRLADDWDATGRPALDCGAHEVELVVAGADNALVGGSYAPAVRVAPGGSLAVSAQSAAPAVLDASGGRFAAAVGGAVDEDAGSFLQRSATLFAAGGASGTPDIGPGAFGAKADGATVLGGSLRPARGLVVPAPSNDVEAVRCVVVDGFEPGAAPDLANLPEGYGTDGVAADQNGYVWLWLPESAESYRFIADGSLRRVAAGGGAVIAETLPDPKVESATFAAAEDGALEVKLRVSSPVEAEALAPAYATDLSALSSGGGERLDPESVEQVGEDEYELAFRLPSSAESGFLVIRAK